MATRSSTDLKDAYLEETDAEEGNVGSVIPRELDAMGIRNEDGETTTPFDAIQGLDEDAIEDADDEVNEDTDVKDIGIGIDGNRTRPMASALIEDEVSINELDDEIGNGDDALASDSADEEEDDEDTDDDDEADTDNLT